MNEQHIVFKPSPAESDVTEVHYRNRHIGDIAQFDDGWWVRYPYSMMWWRTTDQDSAVADVLASGGITKP